MDMHVANLVWCCCLNGKMKHSVFPATSLFLIIAIQVWYCCSSGTLDWLLQRSGHLTHLDLSWYFSYSRSSIINCHLYHLDHHEFPWCGNYGGMSPTSAVLSDDHRHHDYPNHDYLDDDYPEHDYLDPRWCGNYGGLNPTSLSSFLVSVGHQVISKLIINGWFSCAKSCLYWNFITADTSAPGQLSRGNRGCAGEGFVWHDQLYQV